MKSVSFSRIAIVYFESASSKMGSSGIPATWGDYETKFIAVLKSQI
jgi:hypothetical protein